MIDFGRGICGSAETADTRTWLVTNGIGGYASGTISGVLNSRYHGLLIAALNPPLGRTLILTKFEERAEYAGHTYDLSFDIRLGKLDYGDAHRCLERFQLDGAIPIWDFACADALLQKRVWMQHGANTTYIRYRLARATLPLTLTISAIANYRDSHENTHSPDWDVQVTPIARGLKMVAYEGAAPLYLVCDRTDPLIERVWLEDYYLREEAERGLDHLDDNLRTGTFKATLQPGESLTFAASVEPIVVLDGDQSYAARRAYDRQITAQSELDDQPDWIRRLALAADQFIVRRALPEHPDGLTVLAGYPWFSDWGRDTMIALPGLTIATRRFDAAANILRTFARFADRGMLPNRFPDAGEQPEYNTVDAALWYFQAVYEYVTASGDEALLRELFPVLHSIIDWHVRGTRFSIHVDPADGLLYAGEGDVQLTWMDVKIHTRSLPVERLVESSETFWLAPFLALLQIFGVPTPNWVVTPRTGKAVEINSLWYNALMHMQSFAARLGEPDNIYAQMAERVRAGFPRFWNPTRGCCYDVIDTPDDDPDPALRPNQLFAVALPHSPLSDPQRRQVVDICARELLTSFGLRSLAPDDPAYQGQFSGNLVLRDSSYHQGTVWSWLIGAFVSAHLRVYGDKAAARSFLLPFKHHLSDHGLGSISEVFEGTAPFAPRGCFAQAWGVAEVLRAWLLTQE